MPRPTIPQTDIEVERDADGSWDLYGIGLDGGGRAIAYLVIWESMHSIQLRRRGSGEVVFAVNLRLKKPRKRKLDSTLLPVNGFGRKEGK
jgi:hypothetical protein